MHDIGVQAPHGIEPPGEYVVIATNRTGAATVVGDVVQFDLLRGDGDVSTFTGGANSVWGNVVVPTAAGIKLKLIFGVCLEAVADNADLKVMIRGTTTAACTTGDLEDEPLVAAITGAFDSTPAAGEYYWAIAQADESGGLASVYVDGLRGFGQFVS